jgi:hypothetical protein
MHEVAMQVLLLACDAAQHMQAHLHTVQLASRFHVIVQTYALPDLSGCQDDQACKFEMHAISKSMTVMPTACSKPNLQASPANPPCACHRCEGKREACERL